MRSQESAVQFEEVVREHQTMVFRTLARLTGRADGLEDLAQEVFLRLYRALPGFRGEAALSTYLYRIVLNVARDERKRRGRALRRDISLSTPMGEDDFTLEATLASGAASAEALLEEDELAQAVNRHLQALSGVERSVLVLYHQEEQSYEQIALALGMPINTVRTHLHRGRKRLREALLKVRHGKTRVKGVEYAV